MKKLKKQFQHLTKSKNLTYKELHRQLMYNPWTGIFYRKISNARRAKVGDVAGAKSKKGYIVICINYKTYKAHRLAWLYVYGYMPKKTIDHFPDKTKYHNWISNLREASVQCQNRHQGLRKDNKSGVKGVGWFKGKNKWYAYIGINDKTKSLGYYVDLDNAVCARLAGEQCIMDWKENDPNSSAYLYVKEKIQNN